MKQTDWQRKRVRTDTGIEGARDELAEAIIDYANAPFIAVDGERTSSLDDKARHLRNMQYQLEFLDEIKKVDEYERFKAGDLDWSGGDVDFTDFQILVDNFGQLDATGDKGDINHNGIVDFADFIYMVDTYFSN